MRPLVDIKRFLGSMDMDSPNEVIPQGAHRSARNGRFQGLTGNDQWQIIEGNSLLANQDFLPPGTNKTLFAGYDGVNQRIFYWNFNSLGAHGIYIFNTLTDAFQTLLQIGINTDGDILAFSLTGQNIDSADIIYGDPGDGDLLYFLDTLGRPTKININRFLGDPGFTPYALIKRAYINVIKAPPIMPPRVVYENDTTVQANNMINSLFQFAEGWIYDDFEKSVICSASVQVLPVNSFSNVQNIDKSKDARIAIYLQTGDVNVKKLRIYMKQTQNGAKSDWMIVDTIDKADLGIADNGIYRYVFYNDGNYITEDPALSIELFDYVPLKAGCQSLLNGNVLAYGNITEGYDWFRSQFSYTTGGQDNTNLTTTLSGFLYFADFNGSNTGGQPQVNFYITGAGTNNGSNLPTDVQFAASSLSAYAASNGTEIGFTGLANASNNIATILTSIKNALISAGWVLVSQSTNFVTMYYPTGTIDVKATLGTGRQPNTDPIFFRLARYPQSRYSMGLVYYDEDGRTNGVITDVSANVNTLPFNFIGTPTYTEIFLNLNGITPPAWARNYAPVTTNTLTYNKYLNWISNQAISNNDTNAVNKYAYIGITNIDDFNQALLSGATESAATTPVVHYGFSEGDRIRFQGLYRLDRTFVSIPGLDYPILGLAINPIVNGVARTGRFIQIAYPSADILPASFKFDGDPNFQDYLVEIYNVASNASPQTQNTGQSTTDGNVYYEIGYKYGIGNPGQITAYHFGNFGNNQLRIEDGDIFYRRRTIPTGVPYIYEITGTDKYSNRYITPLIPDPGITNSQFTLGPQNKLPASLAATSYPTLTDGGGLSLNTAGSLKQLRLRGKFTIVADLAGEFDAYIKVCTSGTTAIIIPILQNVMLTVNPNPTEVSIDVTYGLPVGAKAWLLFGNVSGVVDFHPQPFQAQHEFVDNINQYIFDSSFSDTYNLVTNSDNRPDVQDTTAKQTNFNTLYRWGQQYQPGTSINDTNRFYFQDADELTKQWGPLMRMIVQGKIMTIFQYLKVGQVGIYQKYIRNNQGETQLIVNDQIIEKNNVSYYVYDGGCGNQSSAMVSSDYAIYFVNPLKGHVLRKSLDGVVIISILYKSQTWAGANLPPYLKSLTYQFGGNARVLGTFKIYPDKAGEYWLMAQGGTDGTTTLPGETLCFDESKNGFPQFEDLNCDFIINAENKLYAFNNGVLWRHDNTTNYANFFGIQYKCSITLIFNDKVAVKKKYLAVAYQCSDFWTSPNNGDINTNMVNPQTSFRQISQLKGVDYDIQESGKYAAFLRDANSGSSAQLALVEGDYLEGSWIEVLFQYQGSAFNYLFSPYILYSPSGRNF